MKLRHKISSQLQERMGLGSGQRRKCNRFDHYDNGSRPMEEIIGDIRRGVAIPVQETFLDPRGLTDLLLSVVQPSSSSAAGTTGRESSTAVIINTTSSSPTSMADPRTSSDGTTAPSPLVETATVPTTSLLPLSGSSWRKPLLEVPLPQHHPLSLPDPREMEEAAARQRAADEEAAELQRRRNANQYRHYGQAYVFWERVGLHPRLVSSLRQMCFTHPTPTQERVLPTVLEAVTKRVQWEGEEERREVEWREREAKGENTSMERNQFNSKKKKKGVEACKEKDVLVSAETGSGKTLVFALPVLQSLLMKVLPPETTSAIPSPSSCHTRRTHPNQGHPEVLTARKVKEEEEEKNQNINLTSANGKTKKKQQKHDRGEEEAETGTEKKKKKVEQEGIANVWPKEGEKQKKTKNEKKKEEEVEEPEEEKDSKTGGEKETEAASSSTTCTTLSPAHSRLMYALILSPTRELALQILQTFRSLCQDIPEIRVGCVVGGMAPEKQQRILNQHPHILIATPGRLWELIQQNEGCYLGHSVCHRLKYVVLDEADRMLHGGKSFEELKQLLARIHCEVLPAGFAQEREAGAEPMEHEELEAGHWDSARQRFIPMEEWKKMKEKQQEEEEEDEGEQQQNKKKKKEIKKSNKVMDTKGKKKGKTSLKQAEEEVEEVEEDEDERSEEERSEEDSSLHNAVDSSFALRRRGRKRKDEPRLIPMPAPPPSWHRVTTFVTSATLSLQVQYERRDYSSTKSRIRTSNADVMGKVLQELSIQSSNALVFNVVPGTKGEEEGVEKEEDEGSGTTSTTLVKGGSTTGIAAKIQETFLRCPDNAKDLYMYYFLKMYGKNERTIIFVNAISMLRRLVKIIEILGIPVVGLHASMQQRQRLKFLDRFRNGEIKVLVATDVASRGLDVKEVRYVLHFQVPRSTDGYIHRCGRTARCGATGLSLLLVNAQEHVSFRKLLASTGRKESDLEVFALQPTVVHQLHAHLRIALQIDKLQKEISKTQAKNQWVRRMSKQAEVDASDMIDDEAEQENAGKAKAIKILSKELKLLQQKFISSGGKGAFRTGAAALGAMLAEEKFQERALRQTFLKKHEVTSASSHTHKKKANKLTHQK